MRIGVLDTIQPSTDSPIRFISKARAARFIQRRIAKWLILGKLLQMVKESEVIRGDAEYLRTRVEIVPAKRKRWKQNLLLWYPHKYQGTPGLNRHNSFLHTESSGPGAPITAATEP